MAEDASETLLLSIKTTKEKIEVEVPVDYTVKQVSGARYDRVLCHMYIGQKPRVSVLCIARLWCAAHLGQRGQPRSVPSHVCGSGSARHRGVLFQITPCPN